MVPAVGADDLESLPRRVEAWSAHHTHLRLYYALGIHPYALVDLDPGQDASTLAQLEDAVVSASDERMRAIGECGLHFGAPSEARPRQIEMTRRQLELARRTAMPAILHCVKAHAALIELLDEAPLAPCVLHSFSGSAELAQAYVRRGHYVSFAGSLLLPNARKITEAARVVPDDRLLIETDSPDQTPVSLRPSVNEPANLPMIAAKLAEIRSEDVGTIASLTYENAQRVFGIETTSK